MVHKSLSSLRLDRRLLYRRGWISDEERARALAELPDVSDKIAPPEEREGGEASGEGPEGAEPASASDA